MRRGSVDLIYRKKRYIWSAIFFILIILNTDIAVTISAASDKKKTFSKYCHWYLFDENIKLRNFMDYHNKAATNWHLKTK